MWVWPMPKLKTAEQKTGTSRVWWDTFLAIHSPIASFSQRGVRPGQIQRQAGAVFERCRGHKMHCSILSRILVIIFTYFSSFFEKLLNLAQALHFKNKKICMDIRSRRRLSMQEHALILLQKKQEANERKNKRKCRIQTHTHTHTPLCRYVYKDCINLDNAYRERKRDSTRLCVCVCERECKRMKMRYCICKIKSTSAAATSHFFWTAKCKMPQLDAAIVVKCSAGYMPSSLLQQLQLQRWLRQHLQTCALAFLAINFSQPTQRRRQQPTIILQQDFLPLSWAVSQLFCFWLFGASSLRPQNETRFAHTHTRRKTVGKLLYIIYRLCLTPAFLYRFFFLSFFLHLGSIWASVELHTGRRLCTYVCIFYMNCSHLGGQTRYLQAHSPYTHTNTRTLVSISLSTCSCGQTRLGVGLATPNALTELKSDHPLPQTAWDGNTNNNSNGNEWRLRQTHTQVHNNVCVWTKLHTKKWRSKQF